MISDTSTDTNGHSNVFSKGGGGTVFEQSVQTAFVTTLLVRGKVPGLPNGEVTEVAFQTTRFGFRTDDVLIKVRSHQGEHQLLAQVKHNLTISVKNKTFQEVMTAFWQDFTNASVFNPVLDRLLIIKSQMTQVDKRDTVVLLNWAKSKTSADDFYREVERIESKVQALKVLSDVLQKANDGQSVDQERLWQFLRCLVILEYDFGQESSNSETNFLNLIRLAKNQTATASEKEIWDGIYAFVARLNKDGGSVTLNSLQTGLFATYFDPTRLDNSYAAIRKLRENGQVVTGPLSSTIDHYHLPRPELREKLMTAIADQKLTIVTGEPGAGKSAITKEVIADVEPDTHVFIFKADQFNKPHLAQVFTEQGIHEGLAQLFTCIAAIPKKLIVIDSFEKLLEADDPNNAFRQFMQLVNDLEDVRVVATSRTYAVDLLVQKYALTGVSLVTVPLLSDAEFEQILQAFPLLQPLANNPQINQLLRSPKYLDFTVGWVLKTTDDVSQLTVTGFKNKLWQHIVEDYTVAGSGMRGKRRKAFMEVALLRAKRMTLYAEPDQADDEALEALVRDNVLSENSSGGQFAPSHDILEDWALIRHIRRVRESNPNAEDFYRQIGNEPALRRAFRLWVEESLRHQPEITFQLMRDTLALTSVERYWADELVVAVLRSDQSALLFTEFESNLLQDSAQFLQRTMHLLRTACKERRQLSWSSKVLLYPVGSGWETILSFVKKHLSRLDQLRPLITGVLIDWGPNLHPGRPASSTAEIEVVKSVLFIYLNQIESGENAWYAKPLKNRIKALIELAFELTEYAQSEVKGILERSVPSSDDTYYRDEDSFYGQIRKMSLSGVHSMSLTEFLPEQVIALAKAIWIRKPRPKKTLNLEQFTPEQLEELRPFIELAQEELELGLDYDDEEDRSSGPNRYYGLESNLDDYPSGIHKTPVYNLLRTSFPKGINFLLEMVNHCTSYYVKSERGRGDGIIEIELQLVGGDWVKQSGSQALWQVYRGDSQAPELLESLLMSLETYLLRMAGRGTDASRTDIKFLFNYLLSRSDSVAISSVLVSVAIAYPEEVGEAMLPLLSVRAFYDWDVQRAIRDAVGMNAPVDFTIAYAQKERYESNQRLHRTKYINGLRGFMLYLNTSSFNESILRTLDKLWEQADEQDTLWRKVLYEMDRRKWQITGVGPEPNTFVVQPAYEPAVQKIVNDYQPRRQFQQQASTAATWIQSIYQKKDIATADYSTWQEIYNRYHDADKLDITYDRPVTLAIIGLRDFGDSISRKQRNWCIKTIIQLLETLISETERSSARSQFLGSIFEQEIALESLPFLVKIAADTKEQRIIVGTLFQVLGSNFSTHEMEPILASLRNELWNVNAALANQIWLSLIQFSQLRKIHDHWQYHHNEKLRKQATKAERLFINKVLSGSTNIVDFTQISLKTWHSHLLVRALVMIPFNTQEEQHLKYIKRFIPLFAEALIESSVRQDPFDRRPLLHGDDETIMQRHLTDFFLYCNHQYSEGVLEQLLQQILHSLTMVSRSRNDRYDFVQWILRLMIAKLGLIIQDRPEPLAKQATTNFWRIWERLYTVNKQAGRHLFGDLLFLDISWEDLNHWTPLEGKRSFFERVVGDFGSDNFYSLLKLLSTIGEQTLMPEGLQWVVDALKTRPENMVYLTTNETERLINRLYQRCAFRIKTEPRLLNNLLQLLDQMIDVGSSHAYITRENLITYKR